ncbi:MAG: hypothetical protein C0483_23635 [Pirellula sp.]|nr:hypothetical protein [Pirellula sp.]
MAASSIVSARPRRARSVDSTGESIASPSFTPQETLSTEPAASPNDQNIDTVEQFLAALYTTRSDGLPAWTNDVDADAAATRNAVTRHAQSLRDLLATAVAAEPGRAAELRKLLKLALGRNGRTTTEKQGKPIPAAAYHSEAGRLSLLRADWSPGAAELAVDWSRPELRWEFRVGQTQFFAGCTLPDVRLNGKTVAVRGSWEEVCWESNVDVDYLELEIALESGARLQRQFILSRRDGLLYIADAVLLADPADVETVLRIPTAQNVALQPAAETREVMLFVGKQQVLLVPPLLPEWRSEKRVGELTSDGKELRLAQSSRQAAALYVPLVVVYDRKRARGECTWRRLTVGENLTLVSQDQACGFRVQIGRENWLAYRSLTDRANRTLLGVNLQTNFLLARFTKEGESEPLVEIDH